jgi:hypothetical protein
MRAIVCRVPHSPARRPRRCSRAGVRLLGRRGRAKPSRVAFKPTPCSPLDLSLPADFRGLQNHSLVVLRGMSKLEFSRTETNGSAYYWQLMITTLPLRILLRIEDLTRAGTRGRGIHPRGYLCTATTCCATAPTLGRPQVGCYSVRSAFYPGSCIRTSGMRLPRTRVDKRGRATIP